MARAFTCDGCGANVEKPKVIGRIIPRDYCDSCATNAEAFLVAEEDNRAHIHRHFEEVRSNLIIVHGKEGQFKLPDVP